MRLGRAVSLERPLYEALKGKSGLCLRPQDAGDTYQGVLLTGCGSRPGERTMLQSTKLEGVGELKKSATLNMEMQNFELALLTLGLALV